MNGSRVPPGRRADPLDPRRQSGKIHGPSCAPPRLAHRVRPRLVAHLRRAVPMSEIAAAPLIMAALGLFFGAVLAFAYRFLRVEENPKIDEVEQLLPGSNCGACGEPGCRGLAGPCATS